MRFKADVYKNTACPFKAVKSWDGSIYFESSFLKPGVNRPFRVSPEGGVLTPDRPGINITVPAIILSREMAEKMVLANA